MIITIAKLYEKLAVKVGKETAENLATFIEHKIKDEVESKTKTLATKEDLANLKGELKQDMATSKIDLVKWMFGFWIAIVLMFLGLYLKK